MYLFPLIPVSLLVLFLLCMPFYAMEARVSDTLYARLEGTGRKIRLITVDEETLEAYGNFTDWSREKCALLVDTLVQDKENAPAVIGLDFLFVSEADETTDRQLAEACAKAGNVVMASNLVYRGETRLDEKGNLYYDSWNISMTEEPFVALQAVADWGFANVHIATDGCVRYTKVTEEYNGGTEESFAYAVYRKYMEYTGQDVQLPRSDGHGKFTFFYSGESGEFSHFSMKDVLEGKIPASEFKDAIVLAGAYAPGFQDSYIAAIGRSVPMYGLEIHANILQALMNGKTAVALPVWLYLLAAGSIVYGFAFHAQRQRLRVILPEAAGMIGLHMLAGRFLARHGYTVPQLYFAVIVFVLALYFIISNYLRERARRKKVLSTFKKYVAPQIVDKISRDGTFALKLGGEKRQAAVLFVDIRGFTSLSENLNPEEVVSILNEYLALTTAAILDNEGTLDKFIGDAAMAVFNAPFDLEDYAYKALLAALAIRDGSLQLAEKLQKQFGRTIGYGIGVNMGDVVVGNIGCEFRMDYTAIGDVVNTASRLEGKAKSGEILISESVYQNLQERIIADPVGEMELKGKSQPVQVYRLIDVKRK